MEAEQGAIACLTLEPVFKSRLGVSQRENVHHRSKRLIKMVQTSVLCPSSRNCSTRRILMLPPAPKPMSQSSEVSMEYRFRVEMFHDQSRHSMRLASLP